MAVNKELKRAFALVMTFAMCMFVMAFASTQNANAASKPGKVKKSTIVFQNTTDTGFTVKYGKSKYAKKYQLAYRAYDNENKAGKWQYKTTGKRSVELTGLTADTKYGVKVRGIRGKKKGPWSAVVNNRTEQENYNLIPNGDVKAGDHIILNNSNNESGKDECVVVYRDDEEEGNCWLVVNISDSWSFYSIDQYLNLEYEDVYVSDTDSSNQKVHKYEETWLKKNKMSAYYNDLPQNIKNAIVPKDIKQYIFYATKDYTRARRNNIQYYKSGRKGNEYYLGLGIFTDKVARSAGKCEVYPLDMLDVYMYMIERDYDPSRLNQALKELSSCSGNSYVYLRSGVVGELNGYYLMTISHAGHAEIFDKKYKTYYDGDKLKNYGSDVRLTSNPAYVIDLDKVQYDVKK
jgi:hypothetical protein